MTTEYKNAEQNIPLKKTQLKLNFKADFVHLAMVYKRLLGALFMRVLLTCYTCANIGTLKN